MSDFNMPPVVSVRDIPTGDECDGCSDRDEVIEVLLEALEAMLNDHRRTDPHHEHLCPLCLSASAAIAKAKP